jgi:hypothetical protein
MDSKVHASSDEATNSLIQGRKTGGRGRDRTGDPLLAKQVLSQLSYTPTVNRRIHSKAFPAAAKKDSI